MIRKLVNVLLCAGLLAACQQKQPEVRDNLWPPVPEEPQFTQIELTSEITMNNCCIGYSRLQTAGYDPTIAARRYALPALRILEEDHVRRDYSRFLALVGSGGYNGGLMQELVGGLKTVEKHYFTRRGMRFPSELALRNQWNRDIIERNDTRLPIANVLRCLDAPPPYQYYIDPDYIGHLVFDVKMGNSAARGYFMRFIILVEIPGDEQIEVYFMMTDYDNLTPTESCPL